MTDEIEVCPLVRLSVCQCRPDIRTAVRIRHVFTPYATYRPRVLHVYATYRPRVHALLLIVLIRPPKTAVLKRLKRLKRLPIGHVFTAYAMYRPRVRVFVRILWRELDFGVLKAHDFFQGINKEFQLPPQTTSATKSIAQSLAEVWRVQLPCESVSQNHFKREP